MHPCQINAPTQPAAMTTTVEAIYEKGSLKLPAPLPLAENAHVTVTIQTDFPGSGDPERAAWLQASADQLTDAWSPEDDIFNELLQK
jgi:predicted DNA-binding antitoxin AbrB/MazE fold protein